jgi:uncharacterized membrane protein HdeD (DUF308 family)
MVLAVPTMESPWIGGSSMGISRSSADTLSANWWAVVLRGVAAMVFGILTLFSPGLTLATLILLFGVYAFADGVLAIAAAIRRRSEERWWMLLLAGIAGIVVALIALAMPGITAIALIYVIAVRAIIVGALEITAAVRLRKVIDGEWMMALAGIASILFGVLILGYPASGALAVLLWIGTYSIIIGAVLIGLGFRLRAWRRDHPGVPLHAV